jgi:Spy/CpxP family protein refolding chaperone
VLNRNIAVALFILSLSIPAFSQQPSSSSDAPRMHHEHGLMPLRGMASDEQIDRAVDTLQRTLALNPDQEAAIRQLARSRRDSFRALREEAKPKFDQLRSTLREPNPDPAAIGRIIIDLKAIHEEALTKQADLENELNSILNPTQQQIVNNLRKQVETMAALRRLGLLGMPESSRGIDMTSSNAQVFDQED